MEIYWLGHGCFRLRGRDATVLTDPCPPSTGFKIGKVAANIVTISRDVAENTYRQAVNGDSKFVTGPGEYEIANVLITGVRTDHGEASKGPRNTAFVFDIDDVRICHLGDLQVPPSSDDAELLSAADVLMVPVGGGSSLDATTAAETISRLDPKIVIPMHFKAGGATGSLEAIEKFLKEMGVEAKPPEQRLTVTKSSVPNDLTVVVLEPRG